MKRNRRWIVIGVVVLLLIATSLVGCVSKSEMEALQAQNANLTQENADLKAELGELEGVRSDLTKLQADYDALETNYDSLQTDYGVVQNRLSEIQKVYPVEKFPDAEALEAWLVAQANPPPSKDAILWLSHAIQLQEAALEDGYIINVEITSTDYRYYAVLCTAILEDNSYCYWDPETDEIYYWLTATQFYPKDVTRKPGLSLRDAWP